MFSADQSFQVNASQGTDVVTVTTTITGDMKQQVDLAVPIPASGTQVVDVTFTPARLKSIAIAPDQDVTITTVTAGTPVVLAIKAVDGFFWHYRSLLANPFTDATKITGFSCVNQSSTATCNPRMQVILDATP